MKVGFIAPQSIAAVNGGVRTQALMTAKHLQELEVDVQFISSWTDLSNSDIDIFHVFVSSQENIGIVSRLYEQGKKIVLSPVLYSNRSVSNIKKLLKVEQTLAKLSRGIRSDFAIKQEICSKADLLLPNTSDESFMVKEAFGISEEKIYVIPNGVEKRFKDSDSTLFEHTKSLKDFVLFAGQASAPRKNVFKLLRAFQNIDSDLVIIGDFSNSEYSKKCLDVASQNKRVHLLPTMPHDSDLLASAYAACKVFILPSQFETPGISAMEAALAGSNIAITEVGGTRDYFEGFAEFISPHSTASIRNGIVKALKKTKTESLKNHILENYTWDKIAEQTLNQYKKVMV